MNKISENIVRLRVMKGLTQDDLAEMLGLSRQTISRWEKGEAEPRGANLKLLCEKFNVTLEQLLGKQPLTFDRKIEIAMDDLKTNIKEEQIKDKNARKTEIIRKVRKIVLIILIFTTLIYASTTIYKFSVLTHISNKVSNYKNLDNYYCEIQTYENNHLQQKEEIYYKDGKYKIEKNVYDDIGKVINSITNIINLEDNIQITYIDGNYEKTEEVYNKEKYENGIYMYNLLPDITKDDLNNKLKNTFKINKLIYKTIKEKNVYNLKINDLNVELNKESYIPSFYTNGENSDNSKKYYKVELNCVEDNNLII